MSAEDDCISLRFCLVNPCAKVHSASCNDDASLFHARGFHVWLLYQMLGFAGQHGFSMLFRSFRVSYARLFPLLGLRRLNLPNRFQSGLKLGVGEMPSNRNIVLDAHGFVVKLDVAEEGFHAI